MAKISTSPARARTDAVHDGSLPERLTDGSVRLLALGLSAGALTWSAAGFVYGFNPGAETDLKITDLTGLVFQFGLCCLLTIMTRTGATGVTRTARVMLRVEWVLLSLAMVWSLAHALLPSARGTVWMGVLDAFWPLSMLGMFIIGIKVAVSGRWRGPARAWPAVAESWAVVTIPALGVFGRSVGDIVGASHLLVGYMTLGLIIAFRPALVRGRD